MTTHRARAFVVTITLIAALDAGLSAQQPVPTKAALQQASDITLANATRYLESWSSEQRVQIVFVIVTRDRLGAKHEHEARTRGGG